MGTTAEKGAYLNNTKLLLKQKINNLGGDITDNTTFRQYAEQLQNVYDIFPKTSYAEGSNITLSNTLKGKLDYEKVYQEVEYIESTGPQYLDTGVIPNTNTKINIGFETIQAGSYGVIFGGEDTFSSNAFHLYRSSGKFDIGFGSKGVGFVTSIDYNTNLKYNLLMDKNGFTINETTETFTPNTISTSNSIYLFAVHRSSSNVVDSNAQKRLFYCKLYDDGVLIRDMIPCYRKSDGVIGMYDKVQDKFYTNIGTSTFTKGADIGDGFGGERVGIGDIKQTQYEGYNLCEAKMPTTTASQGIKFTNNGDGTYTVSGTNSSENSVTFRINQSTQIGGDNLQNYEDGTYTLDLGIADANMGISLMQNVSWTTYLGTGYGTRLVSRAITNATNTFIYVAVKGNASFNTPVTIKPMLVKGSYTESTIPSFEPYVGGTASPNPSFPQDIEVVRGKNRLDVSKNTNGYVLSPTGEENAIANFCISEYIKVEPTTNYTISYKIIDSSADSAMRVGLYDNSKTFISRPNSSNNPYIITTPSNCYYIRLSYHYTSKENIMLEKGSTATSYLPFNTIEVKTSNVNLLPNYRPSTQTLNSVTLTNNGDGTLKLKGTASAYTQFVDSDSFDLEAGTYTLYERNTSYSGVTAQLRSPDGLTTYTQTNTTAVFTLTEKTSVRFRMVLTSGTVINNVDVTPMILKGNVSSNIPSYVEHQEQIKQLSLGEYEFAKIGNYKDTIEYDVENDKVYKNKAINKKIYTGANDENWELDVGYQRAYSTAISNLVLKPSSNDEKLNGISDKLIIETFTDIYINKKQGLACSAGGVISVHIDNITDTFTNVSQFKTWLASNNIILYYALETPVKEEITGTLKDQIKALYYSHSFTGTTIIEIDGQLPLIIKVRALKGN